MTKTIPLTQGKYAIVDDEDYERVSRYSWTACKGYSGRVWYACRTDYSNGKKKISMHRFILNAPDEKLVDHIDMDGLNNTKSNLRLCTQAENLRNRGKPSSNKSGFKGVDFKKDGKWLARISINGKATHIGTFNSAEEAAQAYDGEAHRHHGTFARGNFRGGSQHEVDKRECGNSFEKRLYINNRSGYRGVHRRQDTGKWSAMILVGEKQLSLGSFDTPEQAARAWDLAAIHYRGKGTRTNFPQDEEE